MNILRKGAVALAAVAAMGTTAGFVAAAETASAAPVVVNYTAQEVAAAVIAPNVVAYTFDLYQPSPFAPGYRLAATDAYLCVQGPRVRACTWRLTQTGPRPSELNGNLVVGPIGQIGSINGGTGAWRGAKGIFRAINLVPHVQTDTFAFSTP